MKIDEMLSTHPQKKSDIKDLVACIAACIECANICNICADACLGEEKIDMLKRCIRLDLDCADLCQTTARILSRQTQPEAEFIRIQLDACATICCMCAQECEQHASMHEHCRICASVCRECENACRQLLESGF